MHDELVKIKTFLEEVLVNEKPQKILEISGFDDCAARLISECVEHTNNDHQNNDNTNKIENKTRTISIERVDLLDSIHINTDNIYDNIYSYAYLNDIDLMKKYDMIFIFHLFENLPAEEAKSMLVELLKKTEKSIILVTPIYPYDLETDNAIASIRTYHPIFFLGMDFSYKRQDDIQIYSFFPKIDYPHLKCDEIVDYINDIKKMKIAYILPHLELTGGVKALLQQVKELNKRGHTVNIYYRGDDSNIAIPSWSHLTDNDYANQVVIPPGASYSDFITDEDIIVLGFVNQIDDFEDSKIPVVLWEQGSPAIYGDHDKILFSNSRERFVMHRFYRKPVHLLAVSQTLRDVMKGIFNRESQFFPNGIDTDFYYPSENKENDIPIVLLVGNPSLEFKGFKLATKVLGEVSKMGIPFKVWWASQIEASFNNAPFDVEVFVMPTQKKLAELYRNADVYLSTSLYESFPLPPIEAMASGTAVLATDNGGINTYAEPGNNCLLCEQEDIDSMSFALSSLLLNPDTREFLASEGRKTALTYSFENVAPQLEMCLLKILARRK